MSEPIPSHDVVNVHDQPRRKSWFGRNWFWFVPLLLLILTSPLICCGLGGYFFFETFKAPIDAAVAELNDTPEVTDQLGTPISVGSQINVANLKSTNGNGQATIDCTIRGPEGGAQVEGDMIQTAGKWRIGEVTVTCDDGTVIQVTDEEGATVITAVEPPPEATSSAEQAGGDEVPETEPAEQE